MFIYKTAEYKSQSDEGQSPQAQIVNASRLSNFDFLLNYKGVCKLYFYTSYNFSRAKSWSKRMRVDNGVETIDRVSPPIGNTRALDLINSHQL
jgi:hypothetical protein